MSGKMQGGTTFTRYQNKIDRIDGNLDRQGLASELRQKKIEADLLAKNAKK